MDYTNKVGEIHLQFGRNKGRKIKDVYDDDLGYLKWIIAPSTNFSDRRLVQFIKTYLEARGDIASEDNRSGRSFFPMSQTRPASNIFSSNIESQKVSNAQSKLTQATSNPFTQNPIPTQHFNIFGPPQQPTQQPTQPPQQSTQQSIEATLQKLRSDMIKITRENTELHVVSNRKDRQIQHLTKQNELLKKQLELNRRPQGQMDLIKQNKAQKNLIKELMSYRNFYLRHQAQVRSMQEKEHELAEMLKQLNFGDSKEEEEKVSEAESEQSGL